MAIQESPSFLREFVRLSPTRHDDSLAELQRVAFLDSCVQSALGFDPVLLAHWIVVGRVRKAGGGASAEPVAPTADLRGRSRFANATEQLARSMFLFGG